MLGAFSELLLRLSRPRWLGPKTDHRLKISPVEPLAILLRNNHWARALLVGQIADAAAHRTWPLHSE